jgi:hypothetical protein
MEIHAIYGLVETPTSTYSLEEARSLDPDKNRKEWG